MADVNLRLAGQMRREKEEERLSASRVFSLVHKIFFVFFFVVHPAVDERSMQAIILYLSQNKNDK